MMISHIHDLVAQQAASNPDAQSIIDFDGQVYSYAAHHKAIIEAADVLKSNGVRRGDRVVLVAENCLVVTAFIFAASHVGAACVPVNARMTPAELDRVVAHAAPRLTVFTTHASQDAVVHAMAAAAQDIVTGFGTFSIATNGDSRPTDDNETAVLLYTTGTTGDPKGVMLTHANLIFAGKTSANLRGMTAGDRVYGVLPMTHVFGLASMLMAASHSGAAIQLETRFQPARVYDALMNGVTVFPGVPQMHALLMQYMHEQGIDRLLNSKLHYVSSGAAPLDPTWKSKAEAFYGIALQNGYGMTESTAGICGTRNPIGKADTSVGPPLPDIEIKLDQTVGAGGADGTGEILTRGPHVMKGYFKNSGETAKAIDGEGWLRTGDLGLVDDLGNLQVVGRCKELIIRGGFNVYPPEIETALNDDPDVIQSAVVGRTIDGGNEEILAFVQCVDPATIDLTRLSALAANRLASYKRPSRIIPVAALPAAATGKILKHKLLSTFATLLAEPNEKD